MTEQYIVKPERYVKHYENGEFEYLKDPNKYVFALCRCSLNLSFGICIPKTSTSPRDYSFKCSKCGLEGIVYG